MGSVQLVAKGPLHSTSLYINNDILKSRELTGRGNDKAIQSDWGDSEAV